MGRKPSWSNNTFWYKRKGTHLIKIQPVTKLLGRVGTQFFSIKKSQTANMYEEHMSQASSYKWLKNHKQRA